MGLYWYCGLVQNVKLSHCPIPYPSVSLKFKKKTAVLGLLTNFMLLIFANETMYGKFIRTVHASIYMYVEYLSENIFAITSNKYKEIGLVRGTHYQYTYW